MRHWECQCVYMGRADTVKDTPDRSDKTSDHARDEIEIRES